MHEKRSSAKVAREDPDDKIRELIADLQALRNGDSTVAKLVAYGQRAVGPLQAFLCQGKPSGVYQPRQLAVEALAALGAKDVLMAYLRLPKDIPDAVARFGEEAVESTAARLLAAWRTDDVLTFLLALARERRRVGLLEAFGAFGRQEALPLLEQALEDDYYRPAAEEALRQFGLAARHMLMRSAVTTYPTRDEETPASRRRRRSAMGLLVEMGIAPEDWHDVRPLLVEADPDIVVAACKLATAVADPQDRITSVQRLLAILPVAGWHLQDDIEECLVALAPEGWSMLQDDIMRRMAQPQEQRMRDGALRTLLRVKGRLEASEYRFHREEGRVRESSLTPGVKGIRLDVGSRWDGIDVEACYSYTLSRQTRQGGFCFYTYHEWGVEEPNTPDTYAAVAILRLLGRAVPEVNHCKAWLQAQQDPTGGYPTLVIGSAALKALQLLGAQPLRDPHRFLKDWGRILQLTNPAHLQFPGQLCSVLRCIALWQDYGIAVTEQTREALAAGLGCLQGDNGGYGAPSPNLPDTAAAVALATALDVPVDRTVLAYAWQCERPPYGFNITPLAVSSSLEIQHAGMQVLRHFHAFPREPALIREYVTHCQTALGGFGRAHGTVPRLDDTLRALELLAMLGPAAARPADVPGSACSTHI